MKKHRTPQGLRLGAVGLLAILSALAYAAPTPEEIALSEAWVNEHIAGAQATPAFSLTCAGQETHAFLPRCARAMRQERLDGGRTRYIVEFTDPSSGLVLTYTATHYAQQAAIELLLEVANRGQGDSPLLERIMPIDVGVPVAGGDCLLHYALGDSNSGESFAPREQALASGAPDPFVLSPKAGRSSEDFMPFFNLAHDGRGLVIAIGWSGQWEARFHRTQPEVVRFVAGMQTTHLVLHPGEKIRTPSILLLFWQGADPIRGNNLFRDLMFAHFLPRKDGQPVFTPICASVTETDPDGSYEGPHLRVMAPLAARGIEVFWSDMDPQQWYPGGFPDGTGTWEPDLAKYPRGLKPVGEAARAAGLDYLLWFEPERVAAASRIAKERPEWVSGGAGGGLFKFHIPEARQWLTDYIDAQITEGGVRWVRWDFNIQPLKYWRENDAPDRQGMAEIGHIEGLYAMWDELARRHPGLLIDLCASGGRRIDIEALKRGLPLWHSDMQCSGPRPAAEQLQNGGLYRWVPMHAAGVFAYEPSYLFRSGMTAGNILCVSGSRGVLGTADPDTEEAVRRTVAVFKRVRPFLLGDFYPLFAHSAAEDVWYGYQFHLADKNAGCAFVFRREQCASATTKLALRGIQPEADYIVENQDAPNALTVKGAALSEYTIEIPAAPGAAILYYRKNGS